MWIINIYLDEEITMFEYDSEEEAREAFENIHGCKIISQIVYFNDSNFAEQIKK
jgi:ArsR family metal-binding transcriptional regulator